MATGPTKICPKCGNEFPRTFEHWHRRKRGGVASYCKKCSRTRIDAWRETAKARNTEHPAEYDETKTLICGRCSRSLPLTPDNFGVNRNRGTGFSTVCKHCIQKDKRHRFNCYLRSSKVRNLEWNLTLDEFLSFWGLPCTYCGDNIETVGIDRIDSQKGYSKDNCVPCCEICNEMKLDYSVVDWMTKMKRIITHSNMA